MGTSIVSTISRMLRHVENAVAVILLAVICFITGLQVVFRFVLKHPLSWSDELATFSFVWLALLGAAIGVREKAHIGVDVFVRLLAPRWRWLTELGVVLLLQLFFVCLCKLGISFVGRIGDERAATLGVQMFWVHLALPVNAALMLVHSVPTLVSILTTGRPRPESEPGE